MKTETLLLAAAAGIVALVVLAPQAKAAQAVGDSVSLTLGRRYRWTVETDRPGLHGGVLFELGQAGTNLEILGYPPGDATGHGLVVDANATRPRSVRIGIWQRYADGHSERVISVEDVGAAI